MQNQEMSMEEILASIRKIISEDKRVADKKVPGHGDHTGGHAPVLGNGPVQTSPHVSDVLELNHKIQDDGSIKVLGNGTMNGVMNEQNRFSNGLNTGSVGAKPGFVVPGHAGTENAHAGASVTPRARAQAHLPPVPSASSAVSTPRPASARESFERTHPTPEKIAPKSSLLMSSDTAASSLATLQKVTGEREMPLSSETTLEAMVIDTLKPLLRAWLDAHLPSILERIVREQIQQLVQK